MQIQVNEKKEKRKNLTT